MAAVAATAARGELRPVAGTRVDLASPGQGSGTAISLAAREMLLDVSFPSGGAGRGDILILFDSSSGYYAWKFARLLATEKTAMLTVDFRSHSKAFATGPGPITVAGISRDDGNWELMVEGQWREKVTLNDRYELTGMARVADKAR